MTKHDEDLVGRAKRLEAENRHLRRQQWGGGVVALAAVLVACAAGCSRDAAGSTALDALTRRVAALEHPGTATSIWAKEFVLVGDEGTPVGSLGTSKGVPELELGDGLGKLPGVFLSPSMMKLGGDEASVRFRVEPRYEASINCRVREATGFVTGSVEVFGDKLPSYPGEEKAFEARLQSFDAMRLGTAAVKIARAPGGAEGFSMSSLELDPKQPAALKLVAGSVTSVRLDASPTLTMADETKTTRAQLGVVDLVNTKTGSSTKHAASTITLFGKDGKLLWMMPNE